MKSCGGYWRAFFGYLHTAKGRHDFHDYMKVAVVISLTILLMYLLMAWQAKTF